MTYFPPPLPYHPGQTDAERRPNGATAIIAGVLAVIGGVSGVVLSALALIYVGEQLSAADILPVVALIIMALALIVGAVLLFMRKRIGQWLVAIGCVVNLVLLGCLGVFGFGDDMHNSGLTAGIVGLLVFAVPAVVTLVLAVVAPTTRYLTWWPNKGAAYSPPAIQPPQQWNNPDPPSPWSQDRP